MDLKDTVEPGSVRSSTDLGSGMLEGRQNPYYEKQETANRLNKSNSNK